MAQEHVSHKPGKKAKTIIELRHAEKTYQMGEVKVPALRKVDLEIKEGDFVAIIGHSGSGKSTLLNLVGCLDVPTRGAIKLNNIDIATLSEDELAKIRGRSIGFVFQTFNLIPTMTALENVTLPLIFQEVDAGERRERAEQMLNLVGMERRMHHHPNELSGGEQQRVAIARALVINPDIVLADEPTGNLDYNTGLEIMGLLKTLHEEKKKTLIIVTHERFIAQYAHRIVRLHDGSIVYDGGRDHVEWDAVKEK
jgi:putative ABC transport system ATP-binding protein